MLYEQGYMILYHLLPKDKPTRPERKWRGKVLASMNDFLLVESLEEGYEGVREIIQTNQVTSIEEREITQ